MGKHYEPTIRKAGKRPSRANKHRAYPSHDVPTIPDAVAQRISRGFEELSEHEEKEANAAIAEAMARLRVLKQPRAEVRSADLGTESDDDE